jgi:hypothetical protein
VGKKRSDYDDFRVSEESNGFPDGSLKHWPEAVGDGGWVSKKSTSADIASPMYSNRSFAKQVSDFHQGTSCLPSTALRSNVLGPSVCHLRNDEC